MADGGEGTAEALRASLGGEWRTASVSDPFGRPVEARFALLPDGRAVVEAAAAIGLARLGRDELDPMRASSRGLGELIVAAQDAGASGLVVGLGDSATVDGGAGLREVVGALPAETLVACDVANPLLGPRGAARAFGPQKGASPAQVEELERRLASDPALEPLRRPSRRGRGGRARRRAGVAGSHARSRLGARRGGDRASGAAAWRRAGRHRGGNRGRGVS